MVSWWRRLFSLEGSEPRASSGSGPAPTASGESDVMSPTPDSFTVPADVAEAGELAQSLMDEDRGWRSLISGGMRELTWAQTIDNLNTAVAAYRENPIAFRLVQLQVEHVIGDGVRLSSTDPTIQAELDLWWDHPLNAMEVRQFEFLAALTMDGELFVSRHVNPFDGTSYVRLVPASLIDRIETNPDDLADELRYHQTAQPMTPDTLMRYPSAVQTEGRWWERDQMRHFAVNRPAGVVRGQSDLTPLLPWLRRYRDWLTDRVRLNKYRTAFLWQVTIKGASAQQILRRQAELAVPPNPGSIIVSNENEVWTAVQPQIRADQVAGDGLALRLMVAAGAGIPLFWLAEAEHTARGTASEMAEPTYKHYRQRQLYFGWCLRTMAADALRSRGLVDVGVGDIACEFPELQPDVGLQVGQTMAALGDSLGAAVDRGWVSNADAAALYAHFVGEAASLPSPSSNGSHPTKRPKLARSVLPGSDPRAQEPLPPPAGPMGPGDPAAML